MLCELMQAAYSIRRSVIYPRSCDDTVLFLSFEKVTKSSNLRMRADLAVRDTGYVGTLPHFIPV